MLMDGLQGPLVFAVDIPFVMSNPVEKLLDTREFEGAGGPCFGVPVELRVRRIA